MRIAPDLAWSAFASLLCALVLAACASVALATEFDWVPTPMFASVLSGSPDVLSRYLEGKSVAPVWAPVDMKPAVMRVRGTSTGYLVQFGSAAEAPSYGASSLGRDDATATVLYSAVERQRTLLTGTVTSAALTPRIIARVASRGTLTTVVWQRRGWTFEVTDASRSGYALARELASYVELHRWPRGPGYAVVENAGPESRDSWAAWVVGDQYVGVSEPRDTFEAIRLVSTIREYAGRP